MMAELVSQVFSHLPMLFMMGMTIWYVSSGGSCASEPPDETMKELYEQQVAETRRMNAMLERIAAVVEQRAQ